MHSFHVLQKERQPALRYATLRAHIKEMHDKAIVETLLGEAML